MKKRRILGCLLLVCAFGGCTSVRTTDPPRTATEQFLISTSATLAVEQLSLEDLRGRQVYLDATYLDVIDKSFLVGEIRSHLLLAGARMQEKLEGAEAVLEIRSAGSGIDRYEFLLGIPALPIGAIGSAAGTASVPVTTPELALIKNTRQWGFTSVAIVAYWRDSGEVISSSGPFVGRSEREDWWFLGMGPRSISNIPTTEPLERE